MKPYISIQTLIGFLCLCMIVACKQNDAQKLTSESLKSSQGAAAPLSKSLVYDGYTIDINTDLKTKQTTITSNYQKSNDQSQILEGIYQKDWLADLNKDGHPEVYILFQDKGKSVLSAIAYNNGYPSEIYMIQPGGGFDSLSSIYSIDKNQLVQDFTKPSSDPNNPIVKIRYNLVAGEAGFILKPQGYTPAELNLLKGKYEIKNTGNSNEKYTLEVSDNNYGEWIASFKIVNSKTNATLCEIKGVGDFVNKKMLFRLCGNLRQMRY